MPEISEADLAVRNKALALLDKMAADPKDGMAFKKKIRELVPDAKFPELDIVASATTPILEKLEEQTKLSKTLADRLDSWEKNQKDGKEEAELQSQLDRVKKTYSFTPEGMQKLVERMKEKNNPDVEAVATWVAAQERKARPVTDSALMPSALNLYGSKTPDDNWKALNEDPIGWADQEILKVMQEFADAEAA